MTSQRASRRSVGDQLWELLEPLIPPSPPAKNGRTGRPRVDDRAALEGILFVAENGIAWKKLPTELGFGSGITCWRRLRAWQEAGVWEKCPVTGLLEAFIPRKDESHGSTEEVPG